MEQAKSAEMEKQTLSCHQLHVVWF